MSPLVEWNRAVYALSYRTQDPDEPGRMLTYGLRWAEAFGRPDGIGPGTTEPAGRFPRYADRAERLDLPDGPGLVVGCGLGYLMAELEQEAWGTEIAAWVHEAKGREAPEGVRDRILDVDVRSDGARAEIEDATGGIEWVLTEEVLSSYADAEAADLLDGCERVLGTEDASRIVHLVNGPASIQEPPFNAHTLEEWRAMRPSHRWVGLPGYRTPEGEG